MGGSVNVVNADSATVLGGMYNKVQSNYGTVLGGFRNKISARFSSALGGSKNTANGRFGVTMGYRSKVTGDFAAAFAVSGVSCEVRDDYSLGICAQQFTIRDSGGTINDVTELFDSRARHLADAAEFSKTVDSLSK